MNKKQPVVTPPVVNLERYEEFKVKISQLVPFDLNFGNMTLTEYELLVMTIYRLNELIGIVNMYSTTIDEVLEWLIGDGLQESVLMQLNVWLEDGTLEELINETLFNTKLDKIEFEQFKSEYEVYKLGQKDTNEEVAEQLTHIENNSLFLEEITVNNSDELIEAINNDNYTKITLRKGVYNIDGVLEINKHVDGKGSTIYVNSPFTTSANTKLENILFRSIISTTNNCINLKGGCKIENCTFSRFDTAINQVGICVHGYIKNCTFQYNNNGIWLGSPRTTSMNNFVIENNYFVKHGPNADDLSADGTKDEMVGIGLYLNGGCNHVVIRDNVFEYNSFCGIYVANTTTGKSNDSKIISNYFEGNKITGIYVKFGSVASNQLIIRDSFYARGMNSNSDFIRDDIVLDSSNRSYSTMYGKLNKQILGTGYNITLATDHSYFSLTNQYLNIPFDRTVYSVDSDNFCLVYMCYATQLNSDVTIRDGDTTSLVLHTFENSGGDLRTDIVSMPRNVSKYLSRTLENDEYIRIYEYRVL